MVDAYRVVGGLRQLVQDAHAAAGHGSGGEYGSAEILAADLAGLALQLARWGVTPAQLVWLDLPPTAAYAQAQDLLQRLLRADDLPDALH